MTSVARVLRLAALVVLVAGCTGGQTEPAAVPPQDEAGSYVIRLTADNRFIPDRALVPPGAMVVWDTEGGAHDVTASNGSWSSDDVNGTMRSGDTYARAFDAAGVHEYECKAHRVLGMRGVIEVGSPSTA